MWQVYSYAAGSNNTLAYASATQYQRVFGMSMLSNRAKAPGAKANRSTVSSVSIQIRRHVEALRAAQPLSVAYAVKVIGGLMLLIGYDVCA
jgi:hypothetical protein